MDESATAPSAPPTGGPSSKSSFDAARIQGELKLAARRLFVCDFSRDLATASEVAELKRASEPVVDPLAQAYAGWRRSLLWVAGITLTLASIFKVASYKTMEDMIRDTTADPNQVTQAIQTIGQANLETIDGLLFMLVVPTLVAAGFALFAAKHWSRVRQSRRAARIGFAVLFFLPLLMALFPLREMLELDHLTKEQAEGVKATLGTMMGLIYFVQVAPRAISLFPGLIRSAMTVKTLVPMSPWPAWITVIIAPFYSIFFAVIMILMTQLQGDSTLLLGTGCLVLSPLVYLWKGKELLQAYANPGTDIAAQTTRKFSLALSTLGLVLIAVWMLSMEMFGVAEALEFLFAVIGSLVLVTVVGSDLLVALMHYAHQQAADFAAGPHVSELDARMLQMRRSGFANLSTRTPRPTDVGPAASDTTA